MVDFRLTQSQVAKLDRLLHMEYTAGELAKELATEARHIQHAIDVGCPHRKLQQVVYITGDEFRLWYNQHRDSRKRRLAKGEFYCLSCKARVRPDPDSITSTVQLNRVIQEQGQCPKCGGKVNRYQSTEAAE